MYPLLRQFTAERRLLELPVQAVPQEEDVHVRVILLDAMTSVIISTDSEVLAPSGGAHGQEMYACGTPLTETEGCCEVLA